MKKNEGKTKDWQLADYIKCNKGKVICIPPNWKYDKERSRYSRLCKKGYFKCVTGRERRLGGAYGDYFQRTDKELVPFDSFKKTIEFSRNPPIEITTNT